MHNIGTLRGARYNLYVIVNDVAGHKNVAKRKTKEATLVLKKGAYDKAIKLIHLSPLYPCYPDGGSAVYYCRWPSPATAADDPPPTEINAAQTATTTVNDKTVISETYADAVGLKLPGALTNQAQVSLTEAPE